MSATAGAINLKFRTEIDREGHYCKDVNLGEKGSPGGHVAILANYGTEARNSEFGIPVDHQGHYCKKTKIWVKRTRQEIMRPFRGILGPLPCLGNS